MDARRLAALRAGRKLANTLARGRAGPEASEEAIRNEANGDGWPTSDAEGLTRSSK